MSKNLTKTGASLSTTEDQRKNVEQIKYALVDPELKENSDEFNQLQVQISELPLEEQKEECRNVTWRKNQLDITQGVNELVQKYNIMPSAMQIAHLTGKSHTTVNKHLKELKSTHAFHEDLLTFGTQYSSFLNVIAKQALLGDLRAAKMGIDIVIGANVSPTIQVNNNNIGVVLKEVLSLVPKSEKDKLQSIIEAITCNSDTIEVETNKNLDDEN